MKYLPLEDKKKFKKYALIVMLLFLTTFIALAWSEYLQIENISITSWEKNFNADCGLVLTGGPNRFREGADLLAKSSVKKLIVSGVHPQSKLDEIFPEIYYYGTIDEKNIILEKRSTTTYGNVQSSVALIEALRCRDVVLITSRLHMHRAFRLLRAALSPDVKLFADAVSSGTTVTSYEWLSELSKSVFYNLF